MFCTKCGKQMPEGVRFCTACGNPMNAAPPKEDRPQQPPQPPQQFKQQIPSQKDGYQRTMNKAPVKADNRSRGAIIAIIAIAVVLIGLIVFFAARAIMGKSAASAVSVPTGSAMSPQVSASSTAYQNQSSPSSEAESSGSAENKDYILAGSDTRLITRDELGKLNKDELRIARNEIYARHGRKFNDRELQDYFNSKPWYRGTVEANRFSDNMLSKIELQNLDLIKDYEKRMNGR